MEKRNFSVEKISVGYLETNCYIVWDRNSRKAFIIDPGADSDLIIALVNKHKLIPTAVINTHGHIDHIGANSEIKTFYKIPIYIHKDDEKYFYDSALNGSVFFGEEKRFEKPDFLLENNSVVKNDSIEIKVVHTPGHTPGGICLITEDLIFTGDTLFKGSVGRWDLPGGSEQNLKRSLQIFYSFPKQAKIFPGHGPDSTIGEEVTKNPYLIM